MSDDELRARTERNMERFNIPRGFGIPASREVREAWWRSGADFRWCWPKFDVYKPADTRIRSMFNRYPHNVIGAAVVVFGRCWGVRWKSTRRD